jgi:hypothetical protein
MAAHDECTLEEFKQASAEFSKESKGMDARSLESGWRAVQRVYFGIPVDPLTLLLARGYFDWASKHYMERKLELEGYGNPIRDLRKALGLPVA